MFVEILIDCQLFRFTKAGLKRDQGWTKARPKLDQGLSKSGPRQDQGYTKAGLGMDQVLTDQLTIKSNKFTWQSHYRSKLINVDG